MNMQRAHIDERKTRSIHFRRNARFYRDKSGYSSPFRKGGFLTTFTRYSDLMFGENTGVKGDGGGKTERGGMRGREAMVV